MAKTGTKKDRKRSRRSRCATWARFVAWGHQPLLTADGTWIDAPHRIVARNEGVTFCKDCSKPHPFNIRIIDLTGDDTPARLFNSFEEAACAVRAVVPDFEMFCGWREAAGPGTRRDMRKLVNREEVIQYLLGETVDVGEAPPSLH